MDSISATDSKQHSSLLLITYLCLVVTMNCMNLTGDFVSVRNTKWIDILVAIVVITLHCHKRHFCCISLRVLPCSYYA